MRCSEGRRWRGSLREEKKTYGAGGLELIQRSRHCDGIV